MGSYGLTDEVRAVRERVRKFIDEEVIPAESAIELLSMPKGWCGCCGK